MDEKNIPKITSLNKFPLTFEKNIGQQHEEVKFLVRGNGYTTFFAEKEVVLTLIKEKVDNNLPNENHDLVQNRVEAFIKNKIEQPLRKKEYEISILRMTMEGANTEIDIYGEEEQEGKFNYFKGSNLETWVTNVPIYEKVRYKEVYEGIDVIFYGNPRQLEHDFIVKPGANPNMINFSFQGADSIEIDHGGNLMVKVKLGDVTLEKPKAFQYVNGIETDVEISYKLVEYNKIGFKIDEYDSGLALNIDPILEYSTFLGGSGNEAGYGLAVDSLGCVYITGETSSSDFPTKEATREYKGNKDAFITKLKSDGTGLLYSTFLGGSNEDSGTSIVVDNLGAAYITGMTNSTDFPITEGAYQNSLTGDTAFITKLNSTGTSLIYSTFLGGNSSDYSQGIGIDGEENAYVTGYTYSNNFPIVGVVPQPSFGGYVDAFVTKLNSTGTSLVYSTFLGGSKGDYGYGIVVDKTGCVYVIGTTNSENFPKTPLAYQKILKGEYNAFIAKLKADGTEFIYSTFLGGELYDFGQAIAADKEGNAYVTGITDSSDFPITSNVYQPNFNGDYDCFVTKLNSDGTNLSYSTFLGGSGYESGNGLAVDNKGNAYITGFTKSSNFPTTPGAYENELKGEENVFVTKLNATGTDAVYSTYLGGNGEESGNGITVDALENIYVTGTTASSNFPTTEGAYKRTLSGESDGFVTKLKALEISIEKIDFPDPVILGLQLNYKIKVTKYGMNPAKNVVVMDKLPESFEFIGANTTKGAYNYKDGTITWNIGDMNEGEADILEVKVMPKVAEEVSNKAILTFDGIDPSKEISSTVTTKVVDISAELDKINLMVDTLIDKVDGTEPSAITDIKDTVIEIKKKLDGTETSLVKDIKDQLDVIEGKINNIINPAIVNKLTTGPVVKDSAANSLIIMVNNSTNSQASVKVTVIDHTQNSSVYSSVTLTINEKNAKAKVLPEPPLEYEVIFEGLVDGVYCWTSTSRNSYNPLLTANSFIESNTFRHGNLVVKNNSSVI